MRKGAIPLGARAAKTGLACASRVFSKKLLRRRGAHFGGIWGARVGRTDTRRRGYDGGRGGAHFGGIWGARVGRLDTRRRGYDGVRGLDRWRGLDGWRGGAVWGGGWDRPGDDWRPVGAGTPGMRRGAGRARAARTGGFAVRLDPPQTPGRLTTNGSGRAGDGRQRRTNGNRHTRDGRRRARDRRSGARIRARQAMSIQTSGCMAYPASVHYLRANGKSGSVGDMGMRRMARVGGTLGMSRVGWGDGVAWPGRRGAGDGLG